MVTSLFLELCYREADRRGKYLAVVNRDPLFQSIIRNCDGIICNDTAPFCGKSGMETMKVTYRLMSGKSVTKTTLVPFSIPAEVISRYNG